MSTLESIPNEILMEIFSSLHITDLISSSYVSHHLRAVAELPLYKIVSLTYNAASPSRFQTFLRTIVCRPQLVNCVQLLILRWTSKENMATRLPGNDITQSTAVGRNVVRKYGLIPPIKQAIVLLYLLPKLRRLHVFAPRVPGFIFNEFIHGNDLLPNFPAGFRFLREMKVECSGGRGLTPMEFLTIFGLPTIHKITIPIVRDIAEIEALDYNSITNKSSVTELSFGCNTFSEQSLGRILKFPRALTHFSFHYSGILFDAPEFGLALKSTRTTLQELRLEFVPYHYDEDIGNDSDSDADTSADDLDDDDDDSTDYDSDDDSDKKVTMESLRDWPVLRSIRCPLTPLIGVCLKSSQPCLVDVLPIVIVEFVAEVDDNWTAVAAAYQVVLMLHQRKKRGLHGLAAVGVVGEGSDLVQTGLRSVCNSAGVKMLEQ